MEKRIILFGSVLILIILAVLLIFTPGPEDRVFAEEDASRVIELKRGDTFIIILAENPSTGFSWHFSVKNEAVIEFESEHFIPGEAEGIVGAGGEHEFEFKAMQEGEAQIEFTYYQDWEPDEVAETYTFNFNVKS